AAPAGRNSRSQMQPPKCASAQGGTKMRKDNVFGMAGAVALAAMMAAAAPALAQQQSPMLDDLVAAGTIPPVAERLPANPLVVDGESVGQYGGTWRMDMNGGGDNGLIVKTVAYEGLVRYDHEWAGVLPNLAESWEVNADATEYSFKLREGVKWRDGTPVTTEDIDFTLEMYPETDYAAGGWIDNKNKPVTLEVIDDYNFKFCVCAPNVMFMEALASTDGTHVASLQKKYCS